ncbi:MAG: LacI family DNA-binding transcriptional regulator [Halieaceae bacterium]|nr:LacI family DNA-binding transcriptional regulator [Halieaceae bacterium]
MSTHYPIGGKTQNPWPSMQKIKLINVAEHAGVSKSTVSQYLNGRFGYMSKATRERINAAVIELNYAPNPIARSLKTNKTKTIGVIVRDITGFYSSRAIRGIDDFCKISEYNVLIYNTDFDANVEARSIEALSQLRIDGLIVASTGQNTDLISEQVKRGLPVVEFQLEHDDAKKNIILSDYRQAAFDATEYLIQLGHKRICFATQVYQDVKSRNERYQGFVEALTMNGISVHEQLILFWHRETGFQQLPQSILELDNAPTVFFAQHLAITIELLKQLNQAHVSVPEDVSVLGFDEVPMAEFFKAPITVVKQDPHRIGMQAAKLLLEIIDGKAPPFQRIMIPCSLVIRESCRKI